MTTFAQPVTISNCFSTKDLEKTLDMLDAAGVNFETCGSLAELQLKLAIAGKEFTQDVMSTILVAIYYCDYSMKSDFLNELFSNKELKPFVFNLHFFTLTYVLDFERTIISSELLSQFSFWCHDHAQEVVYRSYGFGLMKTVISEVAKTASLLPFHFYEANKQFLYQHDMEFVMMLEGYARDLAKKDLKYKPILDALESSLSAQRNISQFLQ